MKDLFRSVRIYKKLVYKKINFHFSKKMFIKNSTQTIIHVNIIYITIRKHLYMSYNSQQHEAKVN